jgi:hypothetical protein
MQLKQHTIDGGHHTPAAADSDRTNCCSPDLRVFLATIQGMWLCFQVSSTHSASAACHHPLLLLIVNRAS